MRALHILLVYIFFFLNQGKIEIIISNIHQSLVYCFVFAFSCFSFFIKKIIKNKIFNSCIKALNTQKKHSKINISNISNKPACKINIIYKRTKTKNHFLKENRYLDSFKNKLKPKLGATFGWHNINCFFVNS
jgi:hypothetical protein